jgi:hypothetical protein
MVTDTFITVATLRTQSLTYQPFLAACFDCTINVNHNIRHLLELFGLGDWDELTSQMRTAYQSLGLYDDMRSCIGFDVNWKAYPVDVEQEVLLGNLQNVPSSHRNIRVPIRSLLTKLQDNDESHQNDINIIQNIGLLLRETIEKITNRFLAYSHVLNTTDSRVIFDYIISETSGSGVQPAL